MKDRGWNAYTRRQFLAMKNFAPRETFREVIIVPTGKRHDSGYGTMKFILTKENRIVGVVSGWSDVLHINGIGGYGKYPGPVFDEALHENKVRCVGWRIDCLVKSKCARLISEEECEAEDFIGSDFIFYVTEPKDRGSGE